MADVVLDASALLALINDEPGAVVTSQALPGAKMSALNLSEVVAKLAEVGVTESEIRSALDPLPIDVIPFDATQAFESGLMHTSTRDAGLSLSDRGCLNLAIRLGIPVLTADRIWERLQLSVTVQVIR